MSYKRAMWHSGLTYQQICSHCRVVVRYNDFNLGYRAWYPDGFVYCPRCKAPLRHNELYAINEDGSPVYPQPAPRPNNPQPNVQQQPPATASCTQCGKPYSPGYDHFCSNCGNRLF